MKHMLTLTKGCYGMSDYWDIWHSRDVEGKKWDYSSDFHTGSFPSEDKAREYAKHIGYELIEKIFVK